MFRQVLTLELLGIYTQDAGAIYPRRWNYIPNTLGLYVLS